ncbi:ABC transporter permease [Clostridia bacterium]|nr:ABC transporter permease [Clostridia bacterium]
MKANIAAWAVRVVGLSALVCLWIKMPAIITGAVSLGLLWGIMVLGVFITYRVLDIADLTVEGTIVTGASVAARMITAGFSPFLATVAAMFAGLLAGLVTGILHTKLKIPALLSGILTLTALYSVNLRIMGRPNTPLLPFKVDSVFTPLEKLDLPPGVSSLIVGMVILVLLVLLFYWFFGTELGSAIRATGSNPKMVRAQGINTSTMIILGLMLSNGLTGLSGALIAQHQTFADITMGMGAIVIGLASLIIGEVLFGKRTFKNTLISVICGAVTYRVIIAIVIKLGLAANDLKLFVSATVTLALTLPMAQNNLRTFVKSMKKE